MCIFEALQKCENKNERWRLVTWLENTAKEVAELRLRCIEKGSHSFIPRKLERGTRYFCTVCRIACIKPELANERLKPNWETTKEKECEK